MNKRIIKAQLEDLRVEPLRPDERDTVWQAIQAATPMVSDAPASATPTTSLFLTLRPMYTAIAATLIILISSGATVAAADSARPGDLLFGVDTTVERVRVALADDDKKTELRARFAEERAIEAESLIVEAEERARVSTTTTAWSTVSTTARTNDDSDTRRRAEQAAAQAIAALRTVEAELSEKGNEMALQAVREARLRLEARTEFTDDDADDDRTDDSTTTTTRTAIGNTSTRIDEIEVDVVDGTAYIKIEVNDQKQMSEVSLTDRAAIVTHIASMLGMSEDTVSSIIDIEYNSGSMRSDDSRSDDDHDEDRSERSSDDDRVSDDDHSGRDNDNEDEDRSGRDDDQDEDRSGRDTDEQEDREDRTEGESSDDDVSVIGDTTVLTRVKIEIEDNGAKVEVRFASGREDEYRLNTTNVTEVRADIASRYGVTDAALDSVLRIEIDS